MNLITGVRLLLALTTRRATQRRGRDPADMGTAFGLDATTTLEPTTLEEAQQREQMGTPSRLELRLHRRSTL
ncbi:MAG: hypothetical protein ACXWCU_01675 [Caldimonas sp.]